MQVFHKGKAFHSCASWFKVTITWQLLKQNKAKDSYKLKFIDKLHKCDKHFACFDGIMTVLMPMTYLPVLEYWYCTKSVTEEYFSYQVTDKLNNMLR